jgi:2-keto-4-pentenoate hydratase/2-oxohepta-3-ene-1,7-dioic acid hydratase in catechol pathway
MGIVRFSADSVTEHIGVAFDGVVVDISSVEGAAGELSEALSDSESVCSSARKLRDGGEARTYETEDVTFHSPVLPSKIVRLEGCYEHDVTDEEFNRFVQDDGLSEMDWPSIFAAPVTSTVPPSEDVEIPQFAEKVRPGAELAFVIGEECKYLQPSEALDAVSGLLTVATVTVYDDLPGLFGYKSFDSAIPVGREVVPPETVGGLEVSVSVNGEVLDTRSTSDWRFEAGEIVSSVSEVMSLEPGDLILTGDPIRTDRVLEEGDSVRATVDGVGEVRSDVVRESTEAGIRI